MKLFRAGQDVSLELTPIEFPQKLVDSTVWDRLGLRLKADKNGMSITAVRPGSSAARIGLEPNDVVLRVNQAPVNTAENFKEAIIQARGKPSVLLLVKRGARGYYLTLPF
jgi:serine protease Do